MIKRKLLHDLYAHLPKKEITMIVGPRQAGKTTVMQYLMGELKKSGQKPLFLNLDFDEERQYFSSQLKLLSKIELEIGDSGGYVFIDEIQRLDNAGLFLKGLYDRNFINRYNPSLAIIVNLTLDTKEEVGNTGVYFIPYYRLPELLASL